MFNEQWMNPSPQPSHLSEPDDEDDIFSLHDTIITIPLETPTPSPPSRTEQLELQRIAKTDEAPRSV